MATDETASQSSASEASKPAPKKRSPVERAIVWGLIALLALAVGLEYRGRTGYEQSLGRLQDALEKSRNENNGASKLTIDAATDLLAMAPSVSEPQDSQPPQALVSWFTMLQFLPDRSYRIYLELDRAAEDANVIGVATAADVKEREGMKSRTARILPPADGGGESAVPEPQKSAPMPLSTDGRVGFDMGPTGQLARAEVVQALDLTDQQAAAVAKLVEDSREEISEIRAAGLRGSEVTMIVSGLRDEWAETLNEILDEPRMTRLEQITLQADGPSAIARAAVAEKLGLSEQQQQTVSELQSEFQAGRGDRRSATDEDRAAAQQAYEQKLTDVLTDEQKQRWSQMLGEPIAAPE